MQQNRNSTFFTITGVLAIIMGVLYSITIIGLIAGIPLFIGANKNFAWSKMTNEELQSQRESILIWGIVTSILIFPFGLLGLVAAFNIDGQLTGNPSTNPSANKAVDSMEAKMEKINKLHEMKEKGIIDEEDFKIAKEKILKD